jgi:5-methylcytosine-specific restriction endonuclease McrA
MTNPYYLSREWNQIRAAVLKRDGYRCTNADCTAPRNRLNVHHRIERSDGGSDQPSNLRTLCQSCHSRLTRYENSGLRGCHVDGTPRAKMPSAADWKAGRFG